MNHGFWHVIWGPLGLVNFLYAAVNWGAWRMLRFKRLARHTITALEDLATQTCLLVWHRREYPNVPWTTAAQLDLINLATLPSEICSRGDNQTIMLCWRTSQRCCAVLADLRCDNKR